LEAIEDEAQKSGAKRCSRRVRSTRHNSALIETVVGVLVNTKPATAEEYVATFPPKVQDALRALRDAIYETIPEATETIRYSMPAVMLNGHYVVHYAAWKHHIGLYPIPALPPDLEADVTPLRSTKDTLRLPHGTPIPTDLVKRLLAELVVLRSAEIAPTPTSQTTRSK
jgi:uncharacterized protein YdhG (YjbR/CyaY superfamily)